MFLGLYRPQNIKVMDAEGNVIEIPAPQPEVLGLPFVRVKDNTLVLELAFADSEGVRREEIKLVRQHTLGKGKVVEEPITDLLAFPLSHDQFDRRVLFAKPYVAGSKPLCRSEDGAYPLPEYTGTLNAAMERVAEGLGVNIACATCPFSRWRRADGRNIRDCDHQLQIPFAVVIDDKVFPAYIRFRSSAFKAGKRIADHVAHLKNHNILPYNAGVELHVISVNQLLQTQGLAGHVLSVKRLDPALFLQLSDDLKHKVIELHRNFTQNDNNASDLD